jgi:hypothetical protein
VPSRCLDHSATHKACSQILQDGYRDETNLLILFDPIHGDVEVLLVVLHVEVHSLNLERILMGNHHTNKEIQLEMHWNWQS